MSITTGYAPQRALLDWAQTAQLQTIPQMLLGTVRRVGSSKFLSYKKDGTYHSYTYQETLDRVERLSTALMHLGVEREDRVAQLSANRPEWPLADLSILFCAAVHVPIYPTLAAHQVAYIVRDAGARVLLVSNQEALSKVLSVKDEIPEVRHIVVYDTFTPPSDSGSIKVWALADMLKLGQDKGAEYAAERKKRLDSLQADDVASLVYTSGTTGEPKGAMLMHGNFVSNCSAVAPIIDVNEKDVELSFLPLCHVFERIVYYTMMLSGANIVYAESIDTVAANMLEVHPTLVPSVPRLFEKIHTRIMDGLDKESATKKKIFHWALSVGRAVRLHREAGQPLTIALSLAHKIAHKLVFSKIQARTGGNIRIFISGGAPLRRDIAEFFTDVGFTLLEGYGLTETSPVITFNRPGRQKLGTVGQPAEYVEVRIADDGEILSRGPNIMRGYFNRPDDTRSVIDADGWFHTGDIGNLDSEKYLSITDRKKEILVMSNGKNVAPQPIENLLKSSSYIEQAVIIGDNRNFISALVVPSAAAQAQGAGDKLHTFLEKHVQELCRDLSQYEKVKKIALLDHELTQEAGELTPTLKFKRRVILERYRDKIEGMYEGAPPSGA